MTMREIVGAGRYRHKITIQKPDPASPKGTVGGRLTAWLNVVVDYPAEVTPVSGRSEFLAAQRHASTTHAIALRYSDALAALDATHRVLFGHRTFVMDRPPINTAERNIELILECTEGKRTE